MNKKCHLAVILLLFFVFWFYSYNLTGWLIHDDEGGYLYQAWRMTEGEVPYKDFYTPEAPLFLFTGYLIFKLLGPAVLWVRLFSVITTILTGYLIFLIGRRVYNDKIAITGFLSYLILPVVFFQARLYRSDAHAVFFSVLGLFLFIKAWQDKRRLFFVYSGAIYAIAMGYKLLAVLGAVSLLFFMAYEASKEKKLFILGFLASLGIILMIVYHISPAFLSFIVGYHFDQPTLYAPNLLTTIISNIKDIFMINSVRYGIRDTHSWLIILSFPFVIPYIFIKKDIKKIFSFYLFNICWILLSPYDQTLRYMLFFLPVAVLVFASIILYAFERKKRKLARLFGLAGLVFALARIFIPGLIKDYALANAKESGTLDFAGYIRENTVESDYLACDYGDMLFHARRRTTPFMAGISQAAIIRKGITSDKLINEFEKHNVKMVIIHVKGGIDRDLSLFFGTPFEPEHLITLINSQDGIKFTDYLDQHYRLIDRFDRSGQVFDIFIRK